MKNALLVYNPNSGHFKKNSELAQHYLSEAGIQVTSIPTQHAKHATQIVKDNLNSGYDIVIGMGGDGTLHEIIQGLAGSQIPLGIIPTGTANVFAKYAKIPINIKKACHKIATGTETELPLIQVNDAYAFCWVGIGLDAQIINLAESTYKKKWGKLGFVIATLSLLKSFQIPKFEIQIDNKVMTTNWVLFSNIPLYAGHYIIHKDITPNTEKIHTMACTVHSRAALIKVYYDLFFNRLSKNKAIHFSTCESAKINDPIPTHVDAEIHISPIKLSKSNQSILYIT